MSESTMTTKMETLDPSALSDMASTVTYKSTTETVTLPQGLTSVAGITVVTGGAELSCGSCMLAFCFWKTFIGFSCVAVGLWDQLSHSRKGTSHLLGLGFVILAISFVMAASVAAYNLLTKKEREMTRHLIHLVQLELSKRGSSLGRLHVQVQQLQI
uniref:Transmembrane protein 100 n=1 Tax=Echeneis naucrates TaxID=173247 RepID=A0A665W1P2_ECHNA